MNDNQPVVELIDVHKRYQVPPGLEAPEVLKGASLAVREGESLAIVGPSGSGKSTLLNIIGSLDEPTAGTVMLGGRDLAGLDDDSLARLRAREVGFVFQLHHLLPQCTAFENVMIPTLAAGLDGRDCPQRAEALLDRVGLRDRMHYYPGMLSVGQRQRVALARALINRPRLLLADEPTGSLDRASSEGLTELLVQLNREQAVGSSSPAWGPLTMIVVTHSEQLASRMARRYALRDGLLHELD